MSLVNPHFVNIFLVTVEGNEDIDELIEKEHCASSAISQFAKGHIDIETMLDVIEAQDVDMDEYLDVCCANLEYFQDLGWLAS